MIHVCGCSLSSRFEVDHSWCDLLGVDIENHSAIAGSNQRSWRRLHDAVCEGARRLIMQITTVDRKEWWSPLGPGSEQDHYVERYGDHWTFKFKYGSHIGNPNPLLGKASKIQYNFINEDWERADFLRQHAQFDAWCQAQGAEVIYLASDTYLDCRPKDSIDITDCLTQYHLPNDEWHLNQQGHELVAQRIHEYLKEHCPHWL